MKAICQLGKRGIAGSCVLTQFSEHGMMDLWKNTTFAADNSENAPWGSGGAPSSNYATSGAQAAENIAGGATSVFQDENSDWQNGPKAKHPWYMDQMLPVDLTVYAANEYGKTSVLRIYGVEF